MPDRHVNVSLTFRTPASAPVVLESVLTAIKAERRAGGPLPEVASAAAPPPDVQARDQHRRISLTFCTSSPSAVVLENVLAAINGSASPYELVETRCRVIDFDDVEE